MRFQISRSIVQRLRSTQPYDIYTHAFLQEKRSIEHIIPVRVLHDHKTSQVDPLHLFTTSTGMNRFRSDYRFGGFHEELQSCRASIEYKTSKCLKHPSRRIFYPRTSHRLIAHVMWKMMNQYPSLRDYEDQCIESPEVWNHWLQTPWTPMERWILESKYQHFS